MASSARYKSEVFIPIKKDNQTFEERQKSIWDDMHERMEKRRREWEHEVDSMRRDFFRLKPSDRRKGSSENLLENMDLDNIFYDDSKSGDKKFRVSFDVKEFKPEEISVRTQDSKLLVYAKHEETGTGRNISKEFSRQIDIPKHVHPERLQCTLSNDGILQVEAPVSAPQYDQIKNMASSSPNVLNAAPSKGITRPLHGGSTVMEEDGSKILKMVIDIGRDFGPQDVSVKTVDRKLVVQAKHEEKSAGRTSFREFNREFDLPDHVDPNLVTASMTNEGKLLVEAPLSSYTQGSYVGKPGSTKQPTITIGFANP